MEQPTRPLPDASQRKAARIAGLLFLFALVTAAFNQLYVLSGLVVSGDAAATADNLMRSRALFRMGIASELLAVVGAIALSVALYVLLRPIDGNLALLALAWRVAESTALGLSSLFSILVLSLLGGAGYSAAFEEDQLHALVGLLLAAHSGGYLTALVFFSFGSAVFAWLFLKSGYVPGLLAAFGILASALVLAGSLGAVLFPAISSMGWFAPIFVFELALGLWLLVRGVEARPLAARAA